MPGDVSETVTTGHRLQISELQSFRLQSNGPPRIELQGPNDDVTTFGAVGGGGGGAETAQLSPGCFPLWPVVARP